MSTLEEKIEKLILDVADIKTCLKGYNGNRGFLEDYEQTKADYYKFKRLVLILAAFLAGSGALGISIWQIATALAI